MSSEPPKYTENSFKSMADAAIDSARTKALIDVGRKEGRSDEEIVRDVFKDEVEFESLGRSIASDDKQLNNVHEIPGFILKTNKEIIG